MKKVLPGVGIAVFALLVLTAALGPGTARAKKEQPPARVVMFASDGMRPDLMEKYAKAGAMPTYKKLMKDGRDRRQRHGPGLPAQHGRRLVHDGDRHVPVRARLDEQHVLPGRRPVLEPDVVLRGGHDAGGHDRQRRRARGQEGRPDRLGRRRPGAASRGRPSTSRTSSRTAACSWARRTRRSRPARPSSASTTRSRSVAPARAGRTPAGDPAAPPKQTTWLIRVDVRGAEPEPHLQRLLLRQRHRRRRALRPRDRQPGRQDRRAAPSVDLKVGDFLPIKLMGADGLIGTRAGQTVGHYIKLISLAGRRVAVQALRHVARPRDRDVRHAVQRACPPAAPARTGSRSTSPTTCCRGRRPTSPPRRPASSTRTPTSSRAATSSGPTASRSSTTSSGRSSRTPTSRWSATRSPTRSRTSSWGSSRRRHPTGRRTRATTSRRSSATRRARAAGRRIASTIREGYIRSAYEDADEKLGVTP